jgi:hypothetical protein
MAFCSSAEGAKYRNLAIAFDEEIRSLGPNPMHKK